MSAAQPGDKASGTSHRNHVSPFVEANPTEQSDEWVDPQLQQLGSRCVTAYTALEECLAEHNRDWTRCQQAVQQLKQCQVHK